MSYYKGTIRIGHFGFKKKVFNSFYVQADDILQAMYKIRKKPSTHHHKIPVDLRKISEDEFIIGVCVNPYSKQYDNELVPQTLQEIKMHIVPVLSKERKINKNYCSGNLAKTLLAIVNACDSACSVSEKGLYEHVLKNWIIYNYEHQDEVLGKTENVEEKEM